MSDRGAAALNLCGPMALQTAVRLGGLIQPDGRFVYRYNPVTGAEEGGYNTLRHAGCLWALNDVCRTYSFLPAFHIRRQRALSWLFEVHLSPSPQIGLCLIEGGKMKLGGAALALLALVSAPEDSDAKSAGHANLVRGLCAHIIAQATQDGDFIHKRDAVTGSVDPFRSNYYTGEALFALMITNQARPALFDFEFTRSLLQGLAEREYGVSEQSHWMMYAVEACYTFAPDTSLLAYAGKIGGSILDDLSYRESRRCTPIACRSEALLAWLRTLQRAKLSDLPIFTHAESALKTNILLQLRDRRPDGTFCRGGGSATVRIDYLQHNMTTLFGYSQLSSGRRSL